MIDYTRAVHLLMEDLVARVPALAHIDPGDILVFARLGRSSTHGAYATCHSLMLPDSEPAYYFWRDRRTGALSRRSEWFVARSPEVRIGPRRISHLVSIALPRFCDQTLKDTHKERVYGLGKEWVAKLDTIVHELYHIDPTAEGIRVVGRCDAGVARCHSPEFFEEVAEFVRLYLASGPDPSTYEFLTCDFATLQGRHGAIVATTFRQFPSYPQRYHDRLAEPPGLEPPGVTVVPLAEPRRPTCFTERDLALRVFTERGSRRWVDRDVAHDKAAAAGVRPVRNGARATPAGA
jgi:hypothetical protein